MLTTVTSDRLTRVERAESIAIRVYRELRASLLRRSIAPGERLVEADLAQQLGVSRTPVREALARLVAEGMAVVLPGGGLAAYDPRGELADIYGLRQVLEGYAARLAAARIEPHELDRLDELARQLREAGAAAERGRVVEINNAFHLQIAEAARSPRLIRLINDYRAYFLTPGVLRHYDRTAMRRTEQQHDDIVQALRARDGDAAERHVRAHFEDAMALMLAYAGAEEQLADAEERP